MKLKQAVNALIDRRRMEATKKEVARKSVAIARNYGRPVVASYRQRNPAYWPERDGFYVEDAAGIQTIEDGDEWVEHEQGFYFDALKFGHNITALVFTDGDRPAEIKVTYNGYVVFAEVDGKIAAYAPFPQWEEPFEQIAEAAIKADRKRLEREKVERDKEAERTLSRVWRSVRMLWGG